MLLNVFSLKKKNSNTKQKKNKNKSPSTSQLKLNSIEFKAIFKEETKIIVSLLQIRYLKHT